ncbi:MAG: hypothetical protein AAGA96_10610 [Verrucomicrobiota bacterium]
MTKHEWHDRAEDGEQIYYRAQIHAGKWEFFSTRKSDPEWEKREAFTVAELEALREVLWNKHQRRRVPLKHVEQVDRMIESKRVEEVESTNSSQETT